MAASYLPVLLLFAIALAMAGMMVMMSHMWNPRRPTPQKEMPYESGMIPLGDTRRRFSVKFYVIGILFIVFDVETIFLIPWAVHYRKLGAFGFVEGLLFVVVLGVGLLYAWRKGALEWD
ncbi:MAG: NADH-quinone oxidoreductase subunit A [Gemmatimonadota bacterium]